MVQQLGTNTFTTAKWIVSATASDGTHTTIASALTSATSGDTIFIRPGTYTENITLVAGVNITAYGGDGFTPNVIILGNTTASYNGTVTLTGIQLKTNGAACLTLSGANSSTLNLNSCGISASNATGISMNAANFTVSIINSICSTASNNLLFAVTTGSLVFKFCTGSAGTAANTIAGGIINMSFTNFGEFSITTATTGTFTAQNCTFSNTNQTIFTMAGTGNSLVQNSYLTSGTASAISIGSGCTCGVYDCVINSNNINVITGAGTLNYAGISFTGSSTLVNTTTKTGVGLPIANGTAGQILTSNGAGLIPTFQAASANAFASINIQVFTSTGTYTPTSGMLYCIIEAVGGGGGSGGVATTGAATQAVSSGGGGGGYASGKFSAATIGASQSVTIGAAGAAGAIGNNAGGAGGTTSVGALITATGGAGGAGGLAATGSSTSNSTGGSGSGADFGTVGSPGGGSIASFSAGVFSNILPGNGGSSFFGGGGIGSSTPTAGTSYGGGGGGVANTASQTQQVGAAGFKGVVIVTEYI